MCLRVGVLVRVHVYAYDELNEPGKYEIVTGVQRYLLFAASCTCTRECERASSRSRGSMRQVSSSENKLRLRDRSNVFWPKF